MRRLLFLTLGLALVGCSGTDVPRPADVDGGLGGEAGTPPADAAPSEPDAAVPDASSADAAPPPAGFCTLPNLPSGYAVVTDRAFDQLDDLGWTHRNDAAYTIATDPTAPCSAPSVGQALFKQGFVAGSAPILAAYDLPTPRPRLFVAAWLLLSSNWEGQSSGVNKIFHFWDGSGANNSNRVYLSAQGSGSGKLYAQLRFQGMLPNPSAQTAFHCSSSGKPAAEIVRGAWTRVELELVGNSPGAYDGAARLWVNGTKVCEELALGYVPATSNNLWDLVYWNPTWGGVGGAVSADQTMRMDRVVIATSP